MTADFWAAVRISGGDLSTIVYIKLGFYRYTAPNGTVFMMRRHSASGEPTNEFHIVPSLNETVLRIKIRYTTKIEDLKPGD